MGRRQESHQVSRLSKWWDSFLGPLYCVVQIRNVFRARSLESLREIHADKTCESSAQNLPHDVAVNVGQAEVTTGMVVGEPFVVEAQTVQNRCL